ncbi:hypothetical protein RD110_10005 [Rhodoferax koreense]|uniref:Rhamnogalacturonase A/B/Epimerase-like pectate lyase domain-containing protein n=1 Tax=Rhodoferax koreensis TaxID=1842727 RepID=A0A1P8JUN1_9BURK|nr:glycosyl hydrolase family 28-related protein [Rhodoferax koreense]APW37480.1 hypothetical protein RD110_10005 [Rhodoferax koreense]
MVLACIAMFLAAVPVARAAVGCGAMGCAAFPADAGVIDVKKFGARGDGVNDDTAAILAAIRAADVSFGTAWWRARIVFFPAGTYLVSDTLNKRAADGRYLSGMVLIGASPQTTRLRLKDRAAGYDNAASPKPVIFTSSTLLAGQPTAGGKDYLGKGEGNDAYANYVENMTIDVGNGNPGAVAIDYLANNSGALRHLAIVGGSDSGAIGISMDRKWPGPALLSDISVSGFDIGISASYTEYGVTLDKVTLAGARSIALRNRGNSLSINDMDIDADAVGVQNLDPRGLITAVNLRFSGDGTTATAIENYGAMTLRQVRTQNRAQFFGGPVAGGAVFEGVYQGNARLRSATPSWALPVKPVPVTGITDGVESWVNVQAYGAVGDGVTDSTSAVQQALRSGASTIYFPFGSYVINDTVDVPASVRRIEGAMSTISVKRYNSAPFWLGGGIFKVAANGAPLVIERLSFDMVNKGGKLAIEYVGAAQLVLRDIVAAGITLVDRAETGGELFAENVGGTVRIAGTSGGWIRQLNSEGNGIRVTNNGAPLWILGVKTEQNATMVATTSGGTTELMGGLIYMVNTPSAKNPALTNSGGKVFASYVESSYIATATYDVHLSDQTPGAERIVNATSLAPRGLGRIVPLLATGAFGS